MRNALVGWGESEGLNLKGKEIRDYRVLKGLRRRGRRNTASVGVDGSLAGRWSSNTFLFGFPKGFDVGFWHWELKHQGNQVSAFYRCIIVSILPKR